MSTCPHENTSITMVPYQSADPHAPGGWEGGANLMLVCQDCRTPLREAYAEEEQGRSYEEIKAEIEARRKAKPQHEGELPF